MDREKFQEIVAATQRVREHIHSNQNKDPSEVDKQAENLFQKEMPENIGLIGEEGAFDISENQKYCVLLDPLDNSSLLPFGKSNNISVAATIVEVNSFYEGQSKITGSPVGSVVNPVFDKNRYTSFKGEIAEFSGKTLTEQETLRTGDVSLVSTYAMKQSRSSIMENFLYKISTEYPNTVVSCLGGSLHCASVSWGARTVSGEIGSTVPTEAAGSVFAKHAGMTVTDLEGEPLDTIEATKTSKGLQESFRSLITPNTVIKNQVLECVNVDLLKKQ